MSVKYFVSACCSLSRLSTMKPFSTSESIVSRSSASNVLWPVLIRSSRPVTSDETRSCASEKVFIRNTSLLSGSGTCTLKIDGCIQPLCPKTCSPSDALVRDFFWEKDTVSVHRGLVALYTSNLHTSAASGCLAHSNEEICEGNRRSGQRFAFQPFAFARPTICHADARDRRGERLQRFLGGKTNGQRLVNFLAGSDSSLRGWTTWRT